jgi:[ribosomal protein S5]-alanine N-acetyltransferase
MPWQIIILENKINKIMAFPVLKTKRLLLRQLSNKDEEAIFDLRSDPEVNKYLGRQPCKSIEDAMAFIKKINENIKKGDTYYWAIALTETNQLVGTICLYDLSQNNESCEIGFEIRPQFQKQGIMQEAIQSVIDFAVHTLKVHKVTATTHFENEDSIRLLSKFNFEKALVEEDANPNLIVFTLVL